MKKPRSKSSIFYFPNYTRIIEKKILHKIIPKLFFVLQLKYPKILTNLKSNELNPNTTFKQINK
jgi:hypothetical protein